MVICLYATVYNNVNTIEDSIKSVWKPDYTIVITDNYSTDGTWEKLQELKKEYNLSLYRLKSSRGKGREYSLEHCPDNSKTNYFDLDMEYNQVLHKILQWAPEDKIVYGMKLTGLIAKKETLIMKGGWANLNAAEDTELGTRSIFDYYVPVIIASRNLYQGTVRESRYARGLRFYFRVLNNYVDSIRGSGYNWREWYSINIKIKHKYKYIPLILITYGIAKLKGIHRYSDEFYNVTYESLRAVDKMVLPPEIEDKYFYFSIRQIDNILYPGFENAIDTKLRTKIDYYKKISCNDGVIRYVKNDEGLKNSLNISANPNVQCQEVK